MADADRPIFSIGAVSRSLELPQATIRTWETRYALVVPERTPGGQRLYSRAQVDQLRFLKNAIAGGARPGEAHRLLAEQVDGPGRPKVRVELLGRGDLARVLLSELLERSGFAVVDDAQLVVVSVADEPTAGLIEELKRDGHRVLALVEPGAAEPNADAVLRLPIAPSEVIEAARRLAAI